MAAARDVRWPPPAASDSPTSGVELYRVSDGALIDTDNTNASGFYSLSSGDTSAQMRVRVVNGSVRSARTGGAACTTCVPVQTFRTEGSGNGIVAVTNRVGGEDPALERRHRPIPRPRPHTATLTVNGVRLPQSITTVDAGGQQLDHRGHRFRLQLRHHRQHA